MFHEFITELEIFLSNDKLFVSKENEEAVDANKFHASLSDIVRATRAE